jgi:RNA polymerase primary sigma factor
MTSAQDEHVMEADTMHELNMSHDGGDLIDDPLSSELLPELNMSHDDGDLIDDPLSSDVQPDSMQAYLQEIGRVPLLTAAQEIELARRIADGMLAAEVLAGTTASAEERARACRLKADGDAARAHLVEANLRLVVSIARRYVHRGLPIADLVQEGNIGLMRAAEKFDHRMGNRFSTYATWWIRQAVTRAIAEQSRIIRLPVHVSQLLTQIRRASDQLAQQLERVPTDAEIAAALNQPEERIQQVLQASCAPISLEAPVGEDGEQTVGDRVPDDGAGPVDRIEQQSQAEFLASIVQMLPERDRRVLELRYGLRDDQPRTLAEVGRVLGITRERARQLEAQALRALRSMLSQAA